MWRCASLSVQLRLAATADARFSDRPLDACNWARERRRVRMFFRAMVLPFYGCVIIVVSRNSCSPSWRVRLQSLFTKNAGIEAKINYSTRQIDDSPWIGRIRKRYQIWGDQ